MSGHLKAIGPTGRSTPDHEPEVGMTRTNVMASSRPQTEKATTRSGSSRTRRRLVILPVVLALGLASVAPALAAEPATNGYGNSGAKTPTPKSGTSPSKSTKTPTTTSTTPATAVEPATTSTTPTTATEPAKASTLPFTGFNLTWTVGGGLMLIAAGGSIMVMQRRGRRDGGL
jgi:hypothetical protein